MSPAPNVRFGQITISTPTNPRPTAVMRMARTFSFSRKIANSTVNSGVA